MIRDVIINTNSGLSIFHQNFGNCHSFDADADLFGSFISAIQMLSQKLGNSDIQLIELDEKKLAFEKTPQLTYAVICDIEDENNDIKFKLKRISEIFEEKYVEALTDFKGNVDPFDNFGDILIGMKITNKNCGGRPECEGCPNSNKSLPLQDYIEEIKKKSSFLQNLKNRLFGK